jgi:hypothetical protein
VGKIATNAAVSKEVMDLHDLDDVEAAERVSVRAVVSAAAAFGASVVSPLAMSFVGPVLSPLAPGLVLIVAVSAVRSLSHDDARVIGGRRVLGIALGSVAIALGVLELLWAAAVLYRWWQAAP